MRSILLVILVAACTTETHSIPNLHRVAADACPTSSGDTNGADECVSDADCTNGGVCSCSGSTFEYAHETRNICVPANCHVDADCGAFLCSPSNSDGGPFYGVQGYYCHTSHDTCGRDSDCVQNGTQGYCMFSAEVAHWACAYTFAAG
jgi:hypothetical protein